MESNENRLKKDRVLPRLPGSTEHAILKKQTRRNGIPREERGFLI